MALDLIQILTHAVGFALLVWLLKRFAWGPLLSTLDERKQRIASGLADVERAKQEMARLKGQYEQEMAHIEDSARKKLLEAVNEGRRVAAEIQEEARGKAQAELVKAKEALALEVAKAKTELRDQLVAATLEATEKLLRTRMDDTKDRAIVEQFLRELDDVPTDGQRAPAPKVRA